MVIGVDLDNTIAWYDTSFREVALAEGLISPNWNGNDKTELRDHLRSRPDGETKWMKLQGRVYGKFMYRAEMMPGAANFLLKCKALNHSVFIVSHKTEYGHFDPSKIPLRQEALKWMEVKGFFDSQYFGINRENVFFTDSREEKVEKIACLKCDYFIDDLPEVFGKKNFPKGTQKVLFGQCDNINFSNPVIQINNWADISNHVLGSTTGEDIKVWSNLLLTNPVSRVEKVSGRGNSRVYKVQTSEESSFALKCYPDRLMDARLRLKTEFRTLRILHQNNITNVPRAVEKNEDLDIGIYEWIDGGQVTDPTQSDLKQAVDFVKQLYFLSEETSEAGINQASEACLSGADLIRQIEKRLKILNAEKKTHTELSLFLDQTFPPLWEEVRDASYSAWPAESQGRHLPGKKQILSPSDFGFHNAIRRVDGRLVFIDFDYFGWDDPVKLTADFLWHPAMELNSEIAVEWKSAMFELFSTDPYFESRLEAAMPLYGLRWAMIVLNEFLPGVVEKRKSAGTTHSHDFEKYRSIQLRKATRYCERVKSAVRRQQLPN
ncbi:MAG: aminoglycoside phosphotransferase family protein [Desulfobacterales bacterium]|jgi:hypothetical protein|nr:aminoglycoside phosphotransferase family protein [Desulfobacterales bacterium]MDP6808218.1 aminoglycoside phosphotransferase family protein [Desulfobacterales bacterium]|tara:strand:+ start:6281 stop:7924 length:1644 start_codon:yes stop_codon:yes gene_type:complete